MQDFSLDGNKNGVPYPRTPFYFAAALDELFGDPGEGSPLSPRTANPPHGPGWLFFPKGGLHHNILTLGGACGKKPPK